MQGLGQFVNHLGRRLLRLGVGSLHIWRRLGHSGHGRHVALRGLRRLSVSRHRLLNTHARLLDVVERIVLNLRQTRVKIRPRLAGAQMVTAKV